MWSEYLSNEHRVYFLEDYDLFDHFLSKLAFIILVLTLYTISLTVKIFLIALPFAFVLFLLANASQNKNKELAYKEYVNNSILGLIKPSICKLASFVLRDFLPADWKNKPGAMFVLSYMDEQGIDSVSARLNDSLVFNYACLGIRYLYSSKREGLLKTLISYCLANSTYWEDESRLKRIAHHLDFTKEEYESVLENAYLELPDRYKHNLPYFLGKCNSDSHWKYSRKYKKYKAEFNSNGKQRFFCNKMPHFMDVALPLFAMVVKADRQEMVCEIDIVRDFVRKNDRKHFSSRMNEFAQHLNTNYVVEDIAFATIWFHKSSVMAIFSTMVSMAYADGDFCDTEMNLLRRVASAMHINCEEFEEVLHAATKWAEEEKKRKEEEEEKKGYWTSDGQGNRTFHSSGDSDNSKEQDQTPVSIPYELRKAYEVLGISASSTLSEIKACKRNLMRVNHPDLVANRGDEAVKAATIKCQEINKAFEVVKRYRKC